AISRVPIVWSLHHATVSPQSLSRRTRALVSLGARCSRWMPSAITSVSEHGRRVHVAHGYGTERMVVIPDGFDLDTFRPDAASCDAVRRELGVGPSTRLAGLIARVHPDKGHDTFLAAIDRIGPRADVRFVLCGDGASWQNPALAGEIRRRQLESRCHLLGAR